MRRFVLLDVGGHGLMPALIHICTYHMTMPNGNAILETPRRIAATGY